MSDNMSPVVLVALPSSSYFLGTFDVANFQSFWFSHAVPGQVDYIKKGLHIYGRSHLCIVKLQDGTWEVCKSKNYGIDWEVVFTTSEEIYDIVLIRYGWAVMNTSGGFYETTNAGTTWTQVASLPTAPKAPSLCNIGIANDTQGTGKDVLLCTNGISIWRSVNTARAWTKICDISSVEINDFNGQFTNHTTHYSGPSNPCIAGACDRVLVAAGAFMLESVDGGLTFQTCRYWNGFNATALAPTYYINRWPPRSLVYDRIWESTTNPAFLISQILVTEVSGPTGGDVHFVVKYEDRRPLPGTVLYSRTFSTYGDWMHDVYLGNGFYRYVFQQYISPQSTNNQISSFNLPITGQPANVTDQLTFSAQTRIDPATGKQVISLKYSRDGGLTWTDIDTSASVITDALNVPLYNLSSLGDIFSQNTWVQGWCGNMGYWITSGWRQQNLSQEMDLMIQKKQSKTVSLAAYVSKAKTKDVSLDVNLQGRRPKTFSLDAVFDGKNGHDWYQDFLCQGINSVDFGLDAIIGTGHDHTFSLDALLRSDRSQTYHLGLLLGGLTPMQFSLDMLLERYRLNERLSKMENVTPQFLDLDVPFIPREPYNSEVTTL